MERDKDVKCRLCGKLVVASELGMAHHIGGIRKEGKGWSPPLCDAYAVKFKAGDELALLTVGTAREVICKVTEMSIKEAKEEREAYYNRKLTHRIGGL